MKKTIKFGPPLPLFLGGSSATATSPQCRTWQALPFFCPKGYTFSTCPPRFPTCPPRYFMGKFSSWALTSIKFLPPMPHPKVIQIIRP